MAKEAPMTYKQIVHKIIYDAGYAAEIASLIRRARKKDEEAIKELEERFKPTPEELEGIGLSKKRLHALSCSAASEKDAVHILGTTPTSWMLLDFAGMVP